MSCGPLLECGSHLLSVQGPPPPPRVGVMTPESRLAGTCWVLPAASPHVPQASPVWSAQSWARGVGALPSPGPVRKPSSPLHLAKPRLSPTWPPAPGAPSAPRGAHVPTQEGDQRVCVPSGPWRGQAGHRQSCVVSDRQAGGVPQEGHAACGAAAKVGPLATSEPSVLAEGQRRRVRFPEASAGENAAGSQGKERRRGEDAVPGQGGLGGRGGAPWRVAVAEGARRAGLLASLHTPI